ncbi:MAG: hypothetical protein ACOCXA_02265 [Planctomycetota bacterium]
MPDPVAPVIALARLGLLENRRQGLLVLIGVLVLAAVLALPLLPAVDLADRNRLAVVVLAGSMGLLAMMLAVLVPAAQLRRDSDARAALILFSKPLGLWQYLLGRWLGTQLLIAGVLIMLAGGGLLSMHLGIGPWPEQRQVSEAVSWQRLDAFGQAHPGQRRVLHLSGRAGDAVLLRFQDVGPQAELLLRARVQASDPAWHVDRARIAVTAWPEGRPEAARPATLSERSPYGQPAAGEDALAPGEVVLLDRAESRSDLSRDYARLQLPPGLAGAVIVQLLRLDERSALRLQPPDGSYLSHDGGGLPSNLLRACAVMLAISGLFAAVSLVLAAIGNLGTCLLGGLVLFIAGNSHQLIESVLAAGRYEQFGGRLLALLQRLIPDLQGPGLSAHLGSGQVLPGQVVATAWLQFGGYACLALLLAWLALARREQ